MHAVRCITKVKNRRVTIDLPADFDAERVEVIVLPVESSVQEMNEQTINALLEVDTVGMSKKQRTAIESAHKTLLAGRAPDEPRRLGVFAGLVKVAEDFDAPLPDEDAWWGASTNEMGISTEDR